MTKKISDVGRGEAIESFKSYQKKLKNYSLLCILEANELMRALSVDFFVFKAAVRYRPVRIM